VQGALRTRQVVALVVLGAFIACGAHAAGPTDDHATGLSAFRRGDVTGAMTPLRRAADAGHAPSQALLAYILDTAGLTREALPLYQSSARQGNVDAQVALAGLLVEGRSVPRDARQAFVLYEAAALQGHGFASQAVADAYLRNDAAMLADDATDAKALAALRRAADGGDGRSAERLVAVYQQGQYGVAPDAVEAARWAARVLSQRSRTPGAKK